MIVWLFKYNLYNVCRGTFINVYRCKTTAQRTYNLEIFENLLKFMTNKLISMPQIYIKRWNFRSKMPQMLLSEHTPSTAFFNFFFTKMIINSYLMYCGITCIRLLSDHTPTPSFPCFFLLCVFVVVVYLISLQNWL